MRPVDLAAFRPLGSPFTLYLKGAVPAVTLTWPVYGEPIVAAGRLVVVTWKPAYNVNDWTPFGVSPLEAVKVTGNLPVVAGFPDSVPVPLPLSVNVTPDGSVPDSAIDGVGVPTEVTVNVEEVNVGKLALAAEVMTGAVFTVNVKACVAFGVWPLAAVNVR